MRNDRYRHFASLRCEAAIRSFSEPLTETPHGGRAKRGFAQTQSTETQRGIETGSALPTRAEVACSPR